MNGALGWHRPPAMPGSTQLKVRYVSSGNQGNHRPPERLAGRYDVQEPIGQGASAITYRGWDDRLERVVAIKILRRDLANDDSFVRRFRQEARSAASVAHGNVVDVYDFGQEGADLFIAMQFVDGEDLKHLIQRESPLSPSRVSEVAGQVLDGLQAIHAAGIVHRDIKPQNVLIGRDGIARVTDFGVAHVHEDTGLTTAGTTVGTAAYMAPEQAQAGRVTEATDIYAVGVMLYEMLTGYLPFNAPTAMATMLEHIQREPVAPSQRLPGRGITPAMDSVVLQALAKQPDRRFNSARAMKQAVNHVFGQEAGAHTTVVAPAAAPSSTRVARRPSGQRMEPPPYAPRPATAAAWEDRPVSRNEGAGVKGAVRALLTVIVLALFAVAAWFLFDNLQDDNAGGGVTPTETVEQVVPTETPEPTATDEPEIIAPPDPTEAPTEAPPPTIPPTEAPAPTLEPSPTPEQGLIEPLEPDDVIDPIDITPLPTQSD